MASRNRTDDIGIAPAGAPGRASYDRDIYAWSQEQARLVREGNWAQIDRENVAEEIESLGRKEFDKLESALRVILLHMLKWDHQPERRMRSWELSITELRVEFEQVLGDNPGLKSRLDEALARVYRRARIQAANETGLAEQLFPEACPYPLADVLSRVCTK